MIPLADAIWQGWCWLIGIAVACMVVIPSLATVLARVLA